MTIERIITNKEMNVANIVIISFYIPQNHTHPPVSFYISGNHNHHIPEGYLSIIPPWDGTLYTHPPPLGIFLYIRKS